MTTDVRFEVGDRVELLEPCFGQALGAKGEIIKTDYGSRMPFYVRFNDNRTFWLYDDDISLIKDNDFQHVTKASDLKVGALVRIKSKEWYDANKNESGVVDVQFKFIKAMSELCGKTFRIREMQRTLNGCMEFHLDGEASRWTFCVEMFDLDSDKPKENIVTKTISKVKEAISPSQPIINQNIPLLRKNQLLTNLKLD